MTEQAFFSMEKMTELRDAVRGSKTVSIIIPLYNCEKYISDCIESCINQTYNNIEIIIVDDHSTDNGVKICKRYIERDSRIKIVYLPNNRGRSEARNIGLKASTGEYFMWLDSDDILHPYSVELLFSTIEKNKCEMSICDIELFFDNRQVKYVEIRNDLRVRTCTRQELLNSLLLGNVEGLEIHPACYGRLYLTERFRNVEFVSGQEWAEDFLYSVKVLSNCEKAVYVDCKMYLYRKYDSNEYLDNIINKFENISVEGAQRKSEVWNYLVNMKKVDKSFILPKKYLIKAYYEMLGRYCVCNYLYNKNYSGKSILEDRINDFRRYIEKNALIKHYPIAKRIKLLFALRFYRAYSFVYRLRFLGKSKRETIKKVTGLRG